jgi:hypothetical protein
MFVPQWQTKTPMASFSDGLLSVVFSGCVIATPLTTFEEATILPVWPMRVINGVIDHQGAPRPCGSLGRYSSQFIVSNEVDAGVFY